MAKKEYVLPTVITGPADINRTIIELRQLSEYIQQLALHKDAEVKLPRTTLSLESLAEANHADLLNHTDREHLSAFLESLQQHAPVLQISFASEPSAAFTAQIVDWLRNNISRYALLQVGLQPSIAGGCVLRSTNKIFDMSLRRHLQQNRGKMIELMHALRDKEESAAPARAVEPEPAK